MGRQLNVPGNDLTADTQRLLQDIGQLRRGGLNCTAADLVRPAGIVTEDIVGFVEVTLQGRRVGLQTIRWLVTKLSSADAR